MNNAAFFREGDALIAAWRKWIAFRGFNPATVDSFRSIAFFSTYKASAALRYDVGQVVMDPGSRTYGVVTGYDCHFCCADTVDRITVKCADGNHTWTVSTDDPRRFDPRIPGELLELAKSQLQAKCPLKEAKCPS